MWYYIFYVFEREKNMNNKIRHIITLVTLALSATLAISACEIRTFSSNKSEATSSINNISSSDNNESTPDSSHISSQSSNEIISNHETLSSNETSSSAEISSSSEQASSSASSSSEAPVVLESISAINNQNEYEIGDSLNITVIAHYSDGTSEALNEFNVSNFDNQQSGNQTITITYQGLTTTLDVYVKPLPLINAFPSEALESFLDENEISASVPYPVGYETWTNSNDQDDEKMPVFMASTPDSGTVGTDSIQDTYYALISQDATWTITSSTHYFASKDNAKVEFYTENSVFYFNVHKVDTDPFSSANFPAAQLQVFLTSQSISATIPSPTSNYRWHYGTDNDVSNGDYFYAETTDTGLPGVDAIEDRYLNILDVDGGWTIDDSYYGEDGYYATKGDVEILFYSADNHFSFNAFKYEGEEPEHPITEEEGDWTLVTDINSLQAGDYVVIANKDNGVVAGNLNADGYLNPYSSSFSSNIISNLSISASQFIVGRHGDYWTFTNNKQKLGASAEKTMTFASGSTDWTVNIATNGDATIVNKESSYGTLRYYSTRGRFTTYKTSSTSRHLVQLFKFVKLVPIYPTAISISGKNEIGVGKTTSLSLSFTPSNANQTKATWTSSNENVATVNNGVVRGVTKGNAVITATVKNEADENVSATFNITVLESVMSEWTIMIYMCGSDLESENGLASEDIKEILKVANQPSDVNIILETGGSTKWSNRKISATALCRFHVENKQLVSDGNLENDSMGKQSTFSSFLTWGLTTYPARKTGVIFWNHGGAMDGVCSDENYDDTLLNSETGAAFRTVFNQQNITDKLEFVGYDACLMAVQDVAEFNSKYFNYMVSSEESESGYGWAYDKWLDNLYNGDDTVTILGEICDTFVQSYTDIYGSQYDNDQTLSVLDLSKMDAYRTAFEAFASAIRSKVQSNTNSFKNLIKTAKCYADTYTDYNGYYTYTHEYGYPSSWFETISEGGYTYYYLAGYHLFATFDVYDVLIKIGNNSGYSSYSTQIDNAKNALGELVIHNTIGDEAGESYGLALYCPIEYFHSYSSSETNFTVWRGLVG